MDRLDLTGQTAATLRAYFSQPAAVQDSMSIAGAVVLVISALSFTRALQRLYVRAWRLPKLGVAGNAWGCCGCSHSASSGCCSRSPWASSTARPRRRWRSRSRRRSGSSRRGSSSPGASIHWRRLLPQAPLTSIGISAFALASGLYMPRAVGAAARDFGFIGVAFSLLSWLFVVSVILVVSAALGAVLADPARAGESARAVDRRDR